MAPPDPRPGPAPATAEDIASVKEFLQENFMDALRALDMSLTKIRKKLRQDLMWKAYRPHTGQNDG